MSPTTLAIGTTPSPPRSRTPWLRIAVISLGLAVLALGAGLPLLASESAGWPWNTSIAVQDGQERITVAHDDGRVESFSGSEADARIWLADRESRLKQEYGIPAKVAAGKALLGAAGLLLTAGLVALLQSRLSTSTGRRSH
jgi:hypothetical protein